MPNYSSDDDMECKSINQTTETPLLASLAMGRSEELILSLIEGGCDVNRPDKHGSPPLHLAVSRSLVTAATELIKRGADVNAPDKCGDTPLNHAAECGTLEVVQLLIRHDADVHFANGIGMTPLMTALSLGRRRVAAELIPLYTDISCQNHLEESALDLALKSGDIVAAHHLVLLGAEASYLSLLRTLMLDDSTLFQFLWARVSYEVFLKKQDVPFLLEYLNKCCFPVGERSQHFYLILMSPFALKLVREVENYFNSTNGDSFLSMLWLGLDDHGGQIDILYNMYLRLASVPDFVDS